MDRQLRTWVVLVCKRKYQFLRRELSVHKLLLNIVCPRFRMSLRRCAFLKWKWSILSKGGGDGEPRNLEHGSDDTGDQQDQQDDPDLDVIGVCVSNV